MGSPVNSEAPSYSSSDGAHLLCSSNNKPNIRSKMPNGNGNFNFNVTSTSVNHDVQARLEARNRRLEASLEERERLLSAETDRRSKLEKDLETATRQVNVEKSNLKNLMESGKKEAAANQITRRCLDESREELSKLTAELDSTKSDLQILRGGSASELASQEMRLVNLGHQVGTSKKERAEELEECERLKIQLTTMEEWRRRAAEHFKEKESWKSATLGVAGNNIRPGTTPNNFSRVKL